MKNDLVTVNLKMNSTNSMRSPVAQPQSSQDRHRKRPRNPTQSPSIESDMAISSRHMEAGNASLEASPKSVYEAWTDANQAQLFQWLEMPGNYETWKYAGIRSPSGSTRTCKLTKKTVTCLISRYLGTLQTKKSPEQVMSKMRYVEKKFKEAEDYLRNAGEGLTSTDEKLEIPAIREKVVSICPFFLQVKPFMSESVVGNPSHTGEDGMNENVQEMLLGSTSTRQGLFESMAQQQGDDGNSEEEESSADEEPNFEEEICAEQEPIPQVPSQDTPPVLEITQCRPDPNRQPKEKKKKPKSLQRLVQDMREQNHMLMEKKWDMQLAHQDFLQFLREHSQKQFALESRRLDLEVMRMEQQREDSRIRELALQVELQKLRGVP